MIEGTPRLQGQETAEPLNSYVDGSGRVVIYESPASKILPADELGGSRPARLPAVTEEMRDVAEAADLEADRARQADLNEGPEAAERAARHARGKHISGETN